MKKNMNLLLTAMMITVLFCIPAVAGESSPHTIKGWLAFGTDYYWRGYSSTDNEWAIQAEIDYEHDCGFYAGIWGNNIDGDSEWYDPNTGEYEEEHGDLELDFWIGYWKELGPIELDLTLIYYFYPNNADAGEKNGAPYFGEWKKGWAEADMWEFHIGLAHRFDLPTVPKLSVGYDFSPEFSGEDGIGHHINTVLEMGLPLEILLALEGGWQYVEGDKQTGSAYIAMGGSGFDYKYYRIGISREFLGINCDLSWWTNTEKDWLKSWKYDVPADDQAVITISYSF